MTVLWFIRHAATDENLRYQMIGVTDVPLGTRGTEQAKALSRRLKSVNFEAIYTSPLARARDTAALIAAGNENSLSIRQLEDLREVHLGDFEGVSSFQAYEQFQGMMDEALSSSTNDFAFPGGELRSAAVRRFSQALTDIIHQHPDAEVCVVTHGAVIGFWLSLLHNEPLGMFRTYQPKHASITTIQAVLPQSQSKVITWNDTTHLNAFK